MLTRVLRFALVRFGVSMGVVLLAAGCGGPPAEDIQLRCEVVSEPARAVDVPAQAHAVGVTGAHVFLSWEDGADPEWGWRGRWHALETLEPEGEPVDLGTGPSRRPLWLEVDGGLEGYLLGDLEHRPPSFVLPQDRVTGWRHEPPPLGESQPQRIEMPAYDTMYATTSMGGGWPGTYPMARVGGRVIGGIPAVPGECGHVLANSLRLHVFRMEAPTATPVLWSAPCSFEGGEQLDVLVPWMVSLEDGFGVFFRSEGPIPMPVRYVRIGEDGAPRGSARRVGLTRDARNTHHIGGHQVRAVRLGRTILFSEGTRRADWCSALRLMDVDGTDVRSAPWQLPCKSDDSIIVFPVEMVRSGDYAALLWAERSHVSDRPSGVETTEVTTEWDWWADVKLAYLTREGRLASEPISVLAPESTVLRAWPRTEDSGPFPDNYRISIAPEGDEASDAHAQVVAWTDYRPDAPGVYLRRVHCEPLDAAE